MDAFEARLSSLDLRKPSADFGKGETLAKLVREPNGRIGISPLAIRRRQYAAALAVAVCAAVVFITIILVPNDSRVLAQALGKFQASTSLRFDSVVKVNGKVVDISREYYMPPGLYHSHFTSPGLDEAYAVISVPADRLLIVNLKQRTAELAFFSNTWGDGYLAQTIIETLRRLDVSSARPLGEKLVDGQRTQGYEIIDGDATFSVWTDLATNYPVRVDIKEKDNMGRDVAHVWSNIKFGDDLDPQLFSLAVPDGYKLLPYNHDPVKSSPAGMVASFLKIYRDMQGQFPTSLETAYPELVKRRTTLGDGQTTDADAKLTFVGSATVTVTNSGQKGKDWEYYPERELAPNNQVVFWYFDKSSDKYFVVFADLRVEPMSKQMLSGKINSDEK
jgi:outer membrane lipoprotein-sorting protein